MIDMYNIILYWLSLGVISLLATVPGYVLASLIKGLEDLERFMIAFAFSFLILIALIPLFIFNLSILAYAILFFLFVFSIFQIKKFGISRNLKFLILIFLVQLVLRAFLQTLWQYPIIGGDWFGRALVNPYFFSAGDWTPSATRTPIFALLIYVYHKLFTTSIFSFWITQNIGVVVNSIIIIPAYLMAKRAFGNKIARLSLLFMVINPFLIENSIYTWPKAFAAYFVLMMIYFLFFRSEKRSDYILAGFFGALGYLTHPYAGLFILTAVIILLWRKGIFRSRFYKLKFQKCFYFFIIMLLAVTPYFLWLYSYHGTIFTSRFVYQAFAVGNYPALEGKTSQEIFSAFLAAPPQKVIGIRLENIAATLTPFMAPALKVFYTSDISQQWAFLYHYYYTYAGTLTFFMYLLVVLWFWWFITKRIFRRSSFSKIIKFGRISSSEKTLFTFIWIPFILIMILAGYYSYGLVRDALHPTIPILIIFGFSMLYKIRNVKMRNIFMYLVFIGCIIEGIIFANLINGWYWSLEAGTTASTIAEFIPNFDPSIFTSAHFFAGHDILINFVVLLAIAGIAAYLYKSKKLP